MSIEIIHTDSCKCGNCPTVYKRPFVNIHCHSSSSLLDGVATPAEYAKKAVKLGNPAIVLTDHGNPSQLFDFYKEAKKNGLKPILGLEFYLALDLGLKEPNKKRETEYKDKHQTVLIQDKEGYKNFCKLTYLSFTEGYYYKPRVSYDMLFENKKGLIVTSGCAASMFNQLINIGKTKEAEEWFKRFVREFGSNFYGEIQFNEITDKAKFGINQKEMNDFIIAMSKKYNVPLVIGGDTHYIDKEDAKLQDILIACQRRKDGPAEEQAAESFIHARHLYYHTSEEYYEFNKTFGYNYDEKLITEALDNSITLANTVNFEFELGKPHFPKFVVPGSKKTSNELLADLCWTGLLKKIKERKERGEKFSNELIGKYEKQLEYELKVFAQKDIADYFLIVHDVITWAKTSGIAVGIARGSVGGSLAAYGCNITELDPIQHDLLFERFINPERTAFPDIDCDFAEGTRGLVKEYLQNKYGKESVLGVGTHSIFGALSALQDVSRGLNKDTSRASTLMSEINKLSAPYDYIRKMRNQGTDNKGVIVDVMETSVSLEKIGLAKITLLEFFTAVLAATNPTPTVRQWVNENQDTIKWADKLIGRLKNHGTHAGGILITAGPVYDYIPVTRGGKEVVTAFKEADGSTKDLSELGLLKLDVLGLKTLNVIQNSVKQIKEKEGKDIERDLRYLDLENPDLYKLIRSGRLYGLFQLDGGAKTLVTAIKPTRFEDVVAINALNRPGPKETFGPVYAKWKRYFSERTPEKCEEDGAIFPRLDFMQEVTKQNYYCMIYQEDLMLMVVKAADFNLGEADNFRRAIAWREDNPKYHTVKKYFDTLRDKMLEKGYSQDDVNYFVEYCRNFSGYSFNRAHSAAYAYIAMQCTYLKCYYPAYFYANLANVEHHDNYKDIVASALADGITILPPSITKSKYEFTVENGAIRVGLKALKGLGESAFKDLETYNITPSSNIYEILTLPLKKTPFECLINAGCFDEFGIERNKILFIRDLYKDPKIEKWFTRKRDRLALKSKPPSLTFVPDKEIEEIVNEVKDMESPHLHLVTKLIPLMKKTEDVSDEEKGILEEEILGFSLGLTEKLNQLLELAEKYPTLNLQSLSSRTNDGDLCYWFLLKKTIATTKNGKQYLTLEMTDKSITIKAKCWDMIDLKKGKAYVSHLKQDKFGFTIVVDDFLTEIPLE